MLRLGINGNPA